jgi:hypothetical protein
MENKIAKISLQIWFLFLSVNSFSQCDILNRVSPDGSMWYYMEPVNFYWTKTKSLKGCIVTDRENYFLELQPVPFPQKNEGKKIRNNLALELADRSISELKHYDTRYIMNDSIMAMLFLIDKKDISRLLKNEVISAKIDLEGDEGIRKYEFKLHKSALKEQLACFLEDEKNGKKK